MKVPNFIPKRRLTVSVPVIMLVAIFFAGYYFYYIPVNKDDLHKNGFLILKNIKASLLERNNDYQNLYKNIFDKSIQSDTGLQAFLKNNNIEGKALPFPGTVAANLGANMHNVLPRYNNAATEFQASYLSANSITYLFKNNKDSGSFLLPAESVIAPILQSQKKELFESYLLVNKKNELIYKDPSLSIVSNIPVDSLMPYANAIFASVKNVRIEDVDYKIFSYPLTFGNEDVMLCGFIKASDYYARLHEIPVSFIYPIVITLLLLLIFLPVIKLYLIGNNESIKFIDLTLSAISFIIGPALLTLILIQVLLLWSADVRAKNNLELISQQIDSAFTKDLTNAYRQLDSLDIFISKDTNALKNSSRKYASDTLAAYFTNHKGDSTLDYNLERIFWVDNNGQQILKGQRGNAEPLLTNVLERNYFKIFKNNNAYLLPGQPDSLFGFEPVNSWADGDFTIIVSKRTRLKNGFLVAVATKMPSVTQNILPPGFGFCIINDSGEVQLHSEMNKNLEENIIEKIYPSRQVKEAIASRQASYFDDLKFYGKTNAASIAPVSKMPFFLITYYDKGYIVPITLRIFTFALLFCLFSFCLYAFIWVLFLRRHYYINPLLYSPMLFLKWVIPKKAACAFYIVSMRFLIIYAIVLLAFMFASVPLDISNYVVLIVVLLVPVNVVCSLFVINYTIKNENGSKVKAVQALLYHVAISLLVFVISRLSAYNLEYSFIIFQGLFNLVLWMLFFLPGKFVNEARTGRRSYLACYAGLSAIIIICFVVIPAGVYTWYAHNQEITQGVKKGQLYLAESLQKRGPAIAKYAEKLGEPVVPVGYYENLQYHAGIYKIYNDSVMWSDSQFDPGYFKSSYEQFYFAIANDIGNNYYDPLLLPALKDTTSDNAWTWSKYDSALIFQYNLPGNTTGKTLAKDSLQSLDTSSYKPENKQFYFAIANSNNYYNPFLLPVLQCSIHNTACEPSKYNTSFIFPYNVARNTLSKSLDIISVFPARYVFVGISAKAFGLLLFVIFLIVGLYKLLKSVAERIFLRKYIDTIQRNMTPAKAIDMLVNDYNKLFKKPYPETADDIRSLKNEYDYFTPKNTNSSIYQQEKYMIESLKKLQPFYNFLWNKCSEKEKYLLIDFAQDGLVNFKNIEVIYCLLENGLLRIHDDEIKLFSASFRAYVYSKKDTPEIYEMQKQFLQDSSWQSFRVPLLIILLGIALFIFFTQEETFQKLTAIVAGVSSVVSLLLKFFVDGSNAGVAKK